MHVRPPRIPSSAIAVRRISRSPSSGVPLHRRARITMDRSPHGRKELPMADSLGVIRLDDRPVVDFGGGATYRSILWDDTAGELPIRTGVQVSPPGYETRVHSHPYVETITVLEGRGEVWLDGDETR